MLDRLRRLPPMTGQAHEASASWSKLVAVAIQSMRDLKVDEDKVNVDGGAIAMGHPLGMSGARLVLHLAHALKSRGDGLGVASLWGGGGQGDALVLRVPQQ